MHRCFAVLLLVAALQLLPAPVNASTILYGVDGSGELYTLNTSTGKATLVARSPVGFASSAGLAFLGQEMYVTNFYTNNFDFGTINPTTAAFTFISNQAGSANWQGLAPNRASNLMYTFDYDDDRTLKSVSTAGVGTEIGTETGTGISSGVADLAYDNTNGVLYAIALGGDLYKLNTATGVPTLIGSTGLDVTFEAGMAFDDQTQVLYLNNAPPTGGASLYSINVATAQPTLIGANAVGSIDAIAFTVPEPPSCILFALGGLAFLFGRKRGRRPAV